MSVQPVRAPVGARMEDKLGFWLRIAASHLNQDCARRLQHGGLTPPEWVALRLIGDAGAMAPSWLAEAMATTRGGASKLVSRLEARGLVQRTAAPVDRRGQVLRLTAQGLALSIRMTETADEVEGAFFAPLSPDEATLLRSLLARILRERGHPGSPAG